MSENNEIDDIIKEIRNKNGNSELIFRFNDADNKTASDDLAKKANADLAFSFDDESETISEKIGEIMSEPQQEEKEPEIERITLGHNSTEAEEKLADDENGEYSPEYYEIEYEEPDGLKENKNKKIIIISVAVVLVAVIIAVVAVFASQKNSKEEETTTTKPSTTVTTTAAPVAIINPLTGEKDYNKAAVDVRPVACVVENSYYARPQWGIDSEANSPDIILEGEVEGGESRMLWFYADYTSLPDKVGPMRSARPPFIKFSEMFDAIFIHWGQSQSKGNYVGAKTVFQQDNVDHINEMTTSGVSYLFGRDSSRNGYGVEHTGFLRGDKVAQAIKDCGFRTQADNKSYTKFSFNDKEVKMGETACSTLGLTFSSRSKTRDWSYNEEDKMYHTQDFSNSSIGSSDVKRKNLIVLFDNTQYVVKGNYKNSGRSETYCEYNLAGGSGKLASLGTVIDVTWSVENGLLSVKDASGKEIKLNVGTTWIGWGSANNGGSVKIG